MLNQSNTGPPPASGAQAQHKNGHYTIRRAFIESEPGNDMYELSHAGGGQTGFIDHATMKQILLGKVDTAVILAACQDKEN